MSSIPSIREWARTNGYTVGDRGRIAPAIHTAYRNAFPDAEPEAPRGSVATCNCGRRWTGLRECHCQRCHRHFSTVRWFDHHWQKGKGRDCADPLTILDRAGQPKYKLVDTVWGQVVKLAAERPDRFDAEPDDEEMVLL